MKPRASCRIIFGTGIVNKVYDAFIQLTGMEQASKEAVKQAAAARSPWYRRGIKTLGDIFVPIIPAIVASGFLMGLMEALNFMAANGFVQLDTSGSLFVFAKLFSNTAYVFLPVLIAFRPPRCLGATLSWGRSSASYDHHPDLQNAWTVSSGVEVMQPVFGGLYEVPLVGYQGHVIPVDRSPYGSCARSKSGCIRSCPP